MKNKYPIKIIVLVFLCTFSISKIKGQCNLFEISLEEQIAQSNQIVEGKVISKQSFWDKNRQNIYTVNTIEVYKVFKGQIYETIEVITEGGIVGLQAEVVTPSLNLSITDVGLFILHNTNIDFLPEHSSNLRKFEVYSSVQGFYKYDLFGNRAKNPFNDYEDILGRLYPKIQYLTNSNYLQVNAISIDSLLSAHNESNSINGGFAIFDFSPTTITAGTKSVLTINGAGFGTNVGSVQFSDANDGGLNLYAALSTQIISWSDTQILVEVPSRAGTGIFSVLNSLGFNAFSDSPLNIPFSQINLESDNLNPGTLVAYQTQHIDSNFNGGYTWSMFTGFDSNIPAKNSFLRAFETWVCETGVNWDIGNTTAVNIVANDGINIIRFDVGNELPPGILGRNTSRFNGCFNGSSLDWFVSELDIVFNDTTNWQFGPAVANNFQIDFETVAVHELGHAHQLAHVIDSNKIMHFSVSNGITNRILSQSDIDGGNYVQNVSTSTPVCGNGLMTNSACSLNINDFYLSSNISIYPNPAKSTLFIENPTGISLDSYSIYDISGRLVSNLNSSSSNLTLINVSTLSSGIYFLKLNSKNASTAFKFIID